ncbi:MAG: hypothetical protein [Olavius algarvensis Delta 4 endosymbiont]|nr:MAG: hypothetical protein [Olavius algarvensis Delta 4 endosymbiont]
MKLSFAASYGKFKLDSALSAVFLHDTLTAREAGQSVC